MDEVIPKELSRWIGRSTCAVEMSAEQVRRASIPTVSPPGKRYPETNVADA